MSKVQTTNHRKRKERRSVINFLFSVSSAPSAVRFIKTVYQTAVCLTLLLLPQWANAQEESTSMRCTNGNYVQWHDQTALQLTCQIATPNDHIIILPASSPIDTSLPWAENINDRSAFWLFDIGADDTINLLIDFHDEQGVLTASIFDDRDGDGVVQVDVENGRLLIRESPYWSMRVQAPDGWWQQNGIINYNLDIQVDAPIKSAFGSEIYLGQVENDGRIDFDIKVIDLDKDGRPDQQLIQATPPVKESDGIFRTLIMVNPEDDEVPIATPFMWPLLGDGSASDLVKQYGETLAPIQVDWQSGQIRLLAEFVASRGNEGNWFTYAIDRLVPERDQVANFEAPFAFYDLAGDGDGVPELQIRYEHYPANDRYMANARQRPLPTAHQNVRYSWDQDNDGQWDFKIDTIGQYEATDLISVVDLSFLSFDTAVLPQTVINSTWDGMTFVATETTYRSTEGIYEWPADEIREQWLLGETAVPSQYATLPIGLRGEYRQQSSGTPQLYLSPIDHKLHLLHAEGGRWQLSPTEAIIYRNSNDNGMIDQWQWVQNGTITRQLALSDSYALIADGDSLNIYEGPLATPLWQGAPPTTTAEWLAVQAELTAVLPRTSFAEITAQFNNPIYALTGIRAEQIRPLPTGFQIVAEVEESFFATVGQAHPAGQYQLLFDGEWHIAPLDALWQLDVTVGQTAVSQTAVPIQLTAQKFSDQPDDATYWLVGANDDTEIFRQPLSQSHNALFNYQPTGTASPLTFWIELDNGERLVQVETAVPNQPTSTNAFSLLPTDGETAVLLGMIFLLFSTMLALSAKHALSPGKKFNTKAQRS